jgi:TRAP-type uncharacterized transport system fused permease subunit
LIPLVLLISILVSGRTPYLAAFVGITSCAIVGLTTHAQNNQTKNWVLMVGLHVLLIALSFVDWSANSEFIKLGIFAIGAAATVGLSRLLKISGRISYGVLLEALETGAKYALAVGAAAATVGIVIGVVTLTGVGFKISHIITSAANVLAGGVADLLPPAWFSLQSLTLLAALMH